MSAVEEFAMIANEYTPAESVWDIVVSTVPVAAKETVPASRTNVVLFPPDQL